ncbi:MAG: phosphoglucomutase phosphomannomutase alpha beta alpha domain I [Trebouxia sp. A1-2]|nr:MAG: phosphoglucomutase phosphomannomutase alpha beta alpha domain I [Trebouxia sp. A1-2]
MSLSLLSFRPAIATTAGRRTQDSPCRANLNAASAVLELPKDVEVPKEVAAIFQKLQNGSDIRGIAIAGVDGEEQNITPTVAFFIGVGFASWLSETLKMPANSLHISIGRDSRLSGPLLLASMVAGLASQGVSVAQFGLATTPAMFMSCIIPGYEYDGGIIITASHLPFNRNGFKFFTKEGGLEKGDIKVILQQAAAAAHTAGMAPHARHSDDALVLDAALNTDPSSAQHVDFMPVYAEHLRNIIKQGVDRKDNLEKPLEGFKVAVDPGNGSQFLEPDGWFPNHVPNPEDKTAMAAGVQAVQQSNSDLGVVLDTDVDRSAVVARDGQPINSNRYIALMSLITLRLGLVCPAGVSGGTTIVTDSVHSNGLSDFIKAQAAHYRWKRGYKNVIGKGIELNKAGTDTPS